MVRRGLAYDAGQHGRGGIDVVPAGKIGGDYRAQETLSCEPQRHRSESVVAQTYDFVLYASGTFDLHVRDYSAGPEASPPPRIWDGVLEERLVLACL